MDHCNQVIEQEVTGPPNGFSFGLVSGGTSPFITSGLPRAKDSIHVVPPEGEFHAVASQNGICLTVVVDRDALFQHEGLAPHIADWLQGLGQSCEIVSSPRLTGRLRSDIKSVLKRDLTAMNDEERIAIGHTVLLSLTTALTLEWRDIETVSNLRRTNAYARFRKARRMMLDSTQPSDSRWCRSLGGLGSKRSIERAFSDNVSMGPLTYSRVVRLHKARRKILDAARADESIGDIAAEEGFWDWSRFTCYYRRQFGELPSETRSKRAG